MPSTPTDPAQWRSQAAWHIPLAQLCDSALPTGAFSHSFGLETYVADGVVTDEAGFSNWLTVLVATQLTYAEGLGLRLTSEAAAAGSWQEVARLSGLLAAQAVPSQVRRAGATMGARMLAIARLAVPGPDDGRPSALTRYEALVAQGSCPPHPAAVLALAGTDLRAPTPAVVAAYLFSSVISLTQNAVRCIPLGQNAGQRAIAAAQSEVIRAVGVVSGLDESDLGAVSPGLEIAQMRHERQRARMFMS